MSELTGKQKRHLKALGQSLRAGVIVGREGLTEGTVSAAGAALQRRELLKIRMPPGRSAARKALAEALAGAVGGACVGVVGRTALLYRPNEALPADARICLPT